MKNILRYQNKKNLVMLAFNGEKINFSILVIKGLQ
jgi:hypothetical protein